VDERVWLAKFAGLLPTADATLLHMLYLQDKTYGEVAQYLGISNGNARVLAYRARQHARGVIEGLH
jgi:DNA-directed RNA polymerase specialized sigma24 family protein